MARTSKGGARKRPMATLYYIDARGGMPVTQGHCFDKPENLRRAASNQVFVLERYRRVEVVDTRTGLNLFKLHRTLSGSIDVDYDCAGTPNRNWNWRGKYNEALKLKRGHRK